MITYQEVLEAKKNYTSEQIADIERRLIKDGWYNVAVKMTDAELVQSDLYEDYDEYTEFINFMCRVHHV